jgi:hypothetical protein
MQPDMNSKDELQEIKVHMTWNFLFS